MSFGAVISYLLAITWIYMLYHFFRAFFLSFKMGTAVTKHYKEIGKPLTFPYLPSSTAEVALYASEDSEEMRIARKVRHHKKRALIAFAIALPLLVGIALHTMINGKCVKTSNGFSCTTKSTSLIDEK